MKNNHCKRIFFISVLSFLLIASTVQAQTQYTIDYKNDRKIIKYGEPFSIEITGVNQLDYEYSVKIEYELPKPHTLEGPNLPGYRSSFGAGDIGGSGNIIDDIIKTVGYKNFIKEVNDLLKNRLTKFGTKEIDDWFVELNKKKVNISENELNKLCSDKSDKNGNENCRKEMQGQANKLADYIKSLIGKKDEAGRLIIEEKDIVTSMLKTKSGGALIITIIAKAKKCEVVGGEFEIKFNSKVVEKIGDLKLNESEDKKIKESVKNHLEIRIIRFEFEGPKGITFSMGPYLSFFVKRHEYGRIKNPKFVEGSTDDSSKNKYQIGFTENSKIIYGISAFWNAPFRNVDFGVCWGVAYNLQDKIDRAISGLMGFYFQPRGSTALINFGASIGKIEYLAGGYEIGTGIGENEEIPLQTKLQIGFFISFSFKI